MQTRLLSAALAAIALSIASGRLSAQAKSSICKDGTTSASSGKGACSGHGGVDTKATAAASKKGATSATSAAKSATAPATTAGSAAPTSSAASKSVPTTKGAPATIPPAGASKSAAPAAKSTPATKTAKVSDTDPTDAVAKCKDGTYSHQATHQGACSRHGGVDKFLKP